VDRHRINAVVQHSTTGPVLQGFTIKVNNGAYSVYSSMHVY